MNKLSKAVLVALGLTTLASCGGGGDGGVAAGGTGGTGISQGSVSGFGSVYINGVKFNTDAATTTTVEDSVGTGQTGLKLGMVATVEWEKDATGKYRAKTIKYSDDVQGPFTVTGATTLTVLGQSVIVDALTVFEGDGITSVTNLAELPAGRVVEVSGLKDNTGAIRATRIELKPVTATYELKGIVSDASGIMFTLGTQAVSLSGSATLPANGACVEVKGATLSGAALVATVVETDDSCALGGTVAANMEVELEGYVSGFSASGFKVNGQSVQVTSATVYDDKGVPATIITLLDGAKVEVEGKISNGVLIATKISLDPELGERPESSIEMEIVIGDAIKATATTLTVYGMTVTVNDSTRFEDGIPRDLSDISARPLEIDAYASGPTVIATRIRHQSASTPLLQGPVSAEGTNSLTILGVTVDTSGAVYKNINGDSMSSADFFAAVSTGTVVKAKGTVSANIMTATELEIED